MMNDFPVVLQKASWDCGAACVRAVLAWCHPLHAISETDLDSASKPVWSIDMLSVLRQFGVPCSMYTTNSSGVSEGHRELSWYADGALAEDEQRIAGLYRAAIDAGWPIHERSLPPADFANLLCPGGGAVAIALVCSETLKATADVMETPDCFRGHYVVVVEYDTTRAVVRIMDPASAEGFVELPLKTFEEARKKQGTDEDIIICGLV